MTGNKKKKKKYASYFSSLKSRGCSVFDPTCASFASSRFSLGSSPFHSPVPLLVSRGFIRWRKECASSGLAISSKRPAEREERVAYATERPGRIFRIPWRAK